MRELFERLGLEYRDDDKYILETLQIKEAELLDRLDVVEQEERRKELERQLEEVESVITTLLSNQPRVSTGIYRDIDTFSDLKNGKSRQQNDKTDKEIFDELDSLLETADYLIAIEKLETVGELGNLYAQNKLGYMYRYGKRVNKDLQKAIYWYGKASASGDADAYNSIGRIYESDYKNNQKAYEYYKKAAENGSGFGNYNLGYFYNYGNNVIPINKGMAFEYYKKAADLGVKEGALSTGVCYAKGVGVLQDDSEALKYFHIAAEKGNASAMDWLGLFFFQGRAVVSNMSTAADWYAKAADGGVDRANYDAANLYYQLHDYQKSLNYAIRARDKKIKGGDDIISKIDGIGWVLPNFTAMAEKGFVEQQLKLARAYDSGDKGVDKDDKLAAEWYEKAALAGNPEAQYRIAQRYKNGLGVEKDIDKAQKYFELSKKAGYVAPEIVIEKQTKDTKNKNMFSIIAQIIQMVSPFALGVVCYKYLMNDYLEWWLILLQLVVAGFGFFIYIRGLRRHIYETLILGITVVISTVCWFHNAPAAIMLTVWLVVVTYFTQNCFMDEDDLLNRTVPMMIGAIVNLIYLYGSVIYSIKELVYYAICPLIPSIICLNLIWLKKDKSLTNGSKRHKLILRKAVVWLACLLLSCIGAFLYYKNVLCTFRFDNAIAYIIHGENTGYNTILHSDSYKEMKRYAAYSIDAKHIQNGTKLEDIDYKTAVNHYVWYFYRVLGEGKDITVSIEQDNVDAANANGKFKISFSGDEGIYVASSDEPDRFYKKS
ncbi:MAG: sel1 repeat family protein [Lachnospiraceae bacterium]|nr:sel1 repeat family protein [Lachnospiraceae bacterium]